MKQTKSKHILIITRNLPPLVGGMERLNWHMADELSKYYQVTVIAPKGSKALKPANVDIIEVPLKPLFLFLLCAFFQGFFLTLKLKPKVLLAGSGLTAPLVWLLAKLNHAKAIAYLHGLDITANHVVYRLLWRSSFKRLDRVIINSSPTKALAMQAGVAAEKLDIVCPGVDIPDTMQPQDGIQAFKQQHGLVGKKILLSVGRLTTRKGLREFVENSLPDVVLAAPEAVLVVVGEAPKNSLGAETQSIESIKQMAKNKGVDGNIKFLGKVDEEMLIKALQSADVHVFPIRYIKDDPEGFGMVAIEAAAHGLPTVAFAMGGVIDAVANGQSGYLIEGGNYEGLTQRVVEIVQNDKKIWQTSCRKFAQHFAWQHFGQKVVATIK